MPSSNHSSISDALRQLDPLTRLDGPDLDRLADDAQLLSAGAGSHLIEIGSVDTRQLFLLEGELELIAEDGASHIVRHREGARSGPVSRLRPSRYRVTARTDVRYLLIEQSALEAGPAVGTGVVVEESYSVSEPNNLLDGSASHPVMFDVFNDINLGRVVVPSPAKVAERVGRSLLRHEHHIPRFSDALMACPALTMKTLRAARVHSGTTTRLHSVRDAVNRLGVDKTYALSVSCVFRETLRTDADCIDRAMHAWWERTMQIAEICRFLARSSERFDPEFAAMIGLLHGIAEPVILRYADRYPDLAEAAALEGVIHSNRAELGRILLSMWEMPHELVDAAMLCNHWGYDHAGEADYIDILLVAQWHVMSGHAARPRIPPVEDIPAFAQLGLRSTSTEMLQKIADAGDSAIARIDALLIE